MTHFNLGDFIVYGLDSAVQLNSAAGFIRTLPISISGAGSGAGTAVDGLFEPGAGDLFTTCPNRIDAALTPTTAGVNRWSAAVVYQAAWAATNAGILGGTLWPASGSTPFGIPWGMALAGARLYVGSQNYPAVPGGCWVLAIDTETGLVSKSFDSLASSGGGNAFTWPAVSLDGATLYYVNQEAVSEIKRWDIGGDVQLSDLPAPANQNIYKIRILADGNLFLNSVDTLLGHDLITILDPSSGAVLASYDASALDTPDYTSFITGFNVEPDPFDPGLAWVIMGYSGALSPAPFTYLYHVDVYTGTVIDTLVVTLPDPLDVGFLGGLAAVYNGPPPPLPRSRRTQIHWIGDRVA